MRYKMERTYCKESYTYYNGIKGKDVSIVKDRIYYIITDLPITNEYSICLESIYSDEHYLGIFKNKYFMNQAEFREYRINKILND